MALSDKERHQAQMTMLMENQPVQSAYAKARQGETRKFGLETTNVEINNRDLESLEKPVRLPTEVIVNESFAL